MIEALVTPPACMHRRGHIDRDLRLEAGAAAHLVAHLAGGKVFEQHDEVTGHGIELCRPAARQAHRRRRLLGHLA